MIQHPTTINTVDQLEAALSSPSDALLTELADWDDGLLVLGAGGKMGPTLAMMAARAFEETGNRRRVIAVSRFSDGDVRRRLEDAAVETIACDLLNRGEVGELPKLRNVAFLAGRKFGSTGRESMTWMMNAYVPAVVAEHLRDSRFVVFSSGNVYPFVPVASGGCSEKDPPAPIGEYAQSVLARERVFEHYSLAKNMPVAILRLNYAVELRYGVLVDIALAVASGEPVDVTMGHFNVIWQRDANDYALRAFKLCSTPATILNMTGPETVSTRAAARTLGRLMNRDVRITGEEAPTALLNNSGRIHGLFGYPLTTLDDMYHAVARWVEAGGETHGKPTHFQARDGKF